MELHGGRTYKSRKARPCDFCRSRKTACHMEDSPPCKLCKEKQRPCTFVAGPVRRKRPVRIAKDRGIEDAQNQFELHGGNASNSLISDTLNLGSSLAASREQFQYVNSQRTDNTSGALDFNISNLFDTPFAELDFFYRAPQPNSVSSHHSLLSAASNPTQDAVNGLSPGSLGSQVSNATQGTEPRGLRRERSHLDTVSSSLPLSSDAGTLEPPKGSYARIVGNTGDLDVYILRHRLFDQNDESKPRYPGFVYRRMPTHNSQSGNEAELLSPPPAIFTITDESYTATAEPRLEPATLENARMQIKHLLGNEIGFRLVRLYKKFVHPYFPVLSCCNIPASIEELLNMSPALLAAICATAVAFITYDDYMSIHLPDPPDATILFSYSWMIVMDECRNPRLSTLQTCLLILQRHATNRYVPNTPFRWTVMTISVGISQTLGLNINPTHWAKLPVLERKLRKRLWWCTWIMEKWAALGEGMPSNIHEDDYDVEELQQDDLHDILTDTRDIDVEFTHTYYLATLTSILNEIHRTYFTVRSAKTTADDLQLSLESARPLRAMLKNWQDTLPSYLKPSKKEQDSTSKPFDHLNGNISLNLAYITVQMTLFRALLRPVSTWAVAFSTNSARPSNQSRPTPLTPEGLKGAKAVLRGALTCMKEAVDFCESLGGADWDAFWHSCKSSLYWNARRAIRICS